MSASRSKRLPAGEPWALLLRGDAIFWSLWKCEAEILSTHHRRGGKH